MRDGSEGGGWDWGFDQSKAKQMAVLYYKSTIACHTQIKAKEREKKKRRNTQSGF